MNGLGANNMEYFDDVEPLQPHILSSKDGKELLELIDSAEINGQNIRDLIAAPDQEKFGLKWEIEVAMNVLAPLSRRWNIEICSALYIGGTCRFNHLKGLLSGISSRTLSDKLTSLASDGYVKRLVDNGPPLRTSYELTEKGKKVGRLLGNLVAYLKIDEGYLKINQER